MRSLPYNVHTIVVAKIHAIPMFVSMYLLAVRKIRIITNKPVHRGHTSGQRSLAYVNAGAHYMRQMSGLLKDKVNSLRQNALNDTPQGTVDHQTIIDTSLPIDTFISPYLSMD